MLENEAINQLHNAGLIAESVSTGPYANGYIIAKPQSTPGNTRKNYEVFLRSKQILCDAPCANLYPSNGKWIFEVWEWVPGPGPGDFQQSFTSITECVAPILEYYFGNPSNMNPPELLEIEAEDF